MKRGGSKVNGGDAVKKDVAVDTSKKVTRPAEETAVFGRVLRVQAKKDLQSLSNVVVDLSKYNYKLRAAQANWKPVAGCKGKDCFCQRESEGKKHEKSGR